MTPNPSYEADGRLANQTLIVLVWDLNVWGSVNLDVKKKLQLYFQ